MSHLLTALLLAVVVATLGCDADRSSTPHRELRVFAASSLGQAFPVLGRSFEAAHPGVEVSFSFAGSSSLAKQVNDGASADVFVAADEQSAQAVIDAGNASGPPVLVARNRLALLVERGNPKRISGLADLGRNDVLVVLCAPEVPCGRLAAVALRQAGGLEVSPASLEENVRAVAGKVLLGEADAGLVYATDVRAAGNRADEVQLENAPSSAYLLVVPRSASDRRLARRWADHLLTEPARQVLADHGFLPG